MKSHTTLSTFALIVPLLLLVPYDLEWIADAREVPYQRFAFVGLLVSTCRCLNKALGPLNPYYIMVCPTEFADYQASWRNLASQATSALIRGLRLPHPVVIPPHTESSDYRYMVKLSMTSVRYCLGNRALTQGIRGLHQIHPEPLRTVQEYARSEVFWARVTSGEDWHARPFLQRLREETNHLNVTLQFLSLPRMQGTVDALRDVAENPNP